MLLEGKNAVIYGGGGAIGRAAARAFAREGARVFVTGRRLATVEPVAAEIAAAGGAAEGAQVDALDEDAIEEHLDGLVARAGAVDVSFNAVGFDEVQGVPLVELSLDDFAFPIAAWSRTVFLTGRAAARRMVEQGRGVILTVNAPVGNEALGGGFAVACAAVLAITRILAAEAGPRGVRVLCLQPNAIPESAALRRSVGQHAARQGVPPADFLASIAGETLLGRLPTLDEVAGVAAFVASDRASVMTGSVVRLDCGSAAA